MAKPSIFLAILIGLVSCTTRSSHNNLPTTEEMYIGDSTVIPDIKAVVTKIYDNTEHIIFDLTNKQLREVETFGTNIRAHLSNDSINRIVATSTTARGILSTEWYFVNNYPVYVYETFEFFQEYSNENHWKNFKGLSGWESRYYIVNDRIACIKNIGIPKSTTLSNENRILREGINILNHMLDQKQTSSKNTP